MVISHKRAVPIINPKVEEKKEELKPVLPKVDITEEELTWEKPSIKVKGPIDAKNPPIPVPKPVKPKLEPMGDAETQVIEGKKVSE